VPVHSWSARVCWLERAALGMLHSEQRPLPSIVGGPTERLPCLQVKTSDGCILRGWHLLPTHKVALEVGADESRIGPWGWRGVGLVAGVTLGEEGRGA
jgi:hypothetical protein